MTTPGPQHPRWLDEFAFPEGTAGVVLAFDFGDDGLWAARLDANLDVEATVTEPRITPAVLDLRIASYLRDHGSVSGAEEPAVFAELTDVCRQARGMLAERDSVLLMGTEHLRLVTVSLDSAMAATVPEINRAHGMIVELAEREPVAAIFLGPGTDAWPGLWEALTERGFTILLPEDEFPATYGGDDAATGVLDSVQEETTSLAWADTEADDTDDAPQRIDAAPEDAQPAPRRRSAAVTAAALAVIALAGTGTAIALVGDDEDSKSPDSRSTDAVSANAPSADTTGTPAPEEESPETVARAVPPSDIRAARAEMRRYTPPRTTTPSTTTAPPETAPPSTQVPTAPNRRPTPPLRRTFPNPIPGLPPIVIG